MIALAVIAAFAATRAELVDEVYPIPANEWRYVEVGLKQQAAVVAARFDLDHDAGDVRVALMRREDMEHLRQGLPHGVVQVTGPSRSGALRAFVPPGDYVLVIDNRAVDNRPAMVHLRVWLDFSAPSGPPMTQLSPRRRLTVILISLAVFLGIVTWSARRLLKAVRR